MRKLIVFAAAALALTACQQKGQPQQSSGSNQMQTEQQRNQQVLDNASKSQKDAQDQSKQVESAQNDVQKERSKLSDAEQKLQQTASSAQQTEQRAADASRQAQDSASQAGQRVQQMAQQGAQEGTAAYGASGNNTRGQFVSATQNELVLSSSGSAASNGASSSGQSQMRVPINQDTKVTIDGQPGSINDIKPGSQVQVTFKDDNGQRVASDITATSGGPQ